MAWSFWLRGAAFVQYGVVDGVPEAEFSKVSTILRRPGRRLKAANSGGAMEGQ